MTEYATIDDLMHAKREADDNTLGILQRAVERTAGAQAVALANRKAAVLPSEIRAAMDRLSFANERFTVAKAAYARETLQYNMHYFGE